MVGFRLSWLLGAMVVAAALGVSSIAAGQETPRTHPPVYSKDRLIKLNGSNREAEVAVARGAAWLARRQGDDGSWKFDGSSNDHVAATGLALLPFLAVDQAPNGSDKYSKTVKRGLDWLIHQLDKDGSFKGTRGEFAQAVGTIALCDAARLSRDDGFRAKARLAVKHIVKSQSLDGTWGVRRRKPDSYDTKAIGWQIQALNSARLAGIDFDKGSVYARTDKFLKSISPDFGASYGKVDGLPSERITAVALLSRYLMGTMKPTDPAFLKGVDNLKGRPPEGDLSDREYYYFATRVLFACGGDDWHKSWNPKMRDKLIDLMEKRGDDAIRGSWEPDKGDFGDRYGRLGTGCLSILTLEVYYRYRERAELDGSAAQK